jgi:hypothetical protein
VQRCLQFMVAAPASPLDRHLLLACAPITMITVATVHLPTPSLHRPEMPRPCGHCHAM